MKIFADLHMHSHYSRATSKKMNIENIERYGKLKGLNVIGMGDFTHPLWLNEMRQSLKEIDGKGLFRYKDEGVSFMLSAEISLIYPQDGKTRRVHHVMLAPSFDVVDQITELLLKYGRIDYDGRPIFGKLPSYELVEKLMEISKDIMVIPAHVWTPWYSLFGSMSGFDDPKDCFKDQIKHIHAIETGMSSDPQMNWRVSSLDRFTLVSNSDSHSPWLNRLGREANVLDTGLSYKEITNVIKKGNKKFLYTIETNPSWGKYHWDGHRNCNIVMSPKETKKNKGLCPVCGKNLTIGVEYRVEEMADRKEGAVKDNSIPFKTLLPLSEIVAFYFDTQPYTKKVWGDVERMLKKFDTEFNILLEAEERDLNLVTDKNIAKLIMMNREGKLKVEPGYDGVYGKLVMDKKMKIVKPQKSLSSFTKG